MTETAMEAAELGKRFRRRGGWALRDCTFRLPTGRVCAVVGPNGAGKSTLLALAAGLLAPTEGSVTVLGRHPAEARTRVGFVDQDKPLYPQLTVAETLRMGADLNPGRWDASTAERIVADGDLDPKARIRSLSGGQRTRVALALALAKRPGLLLLDEPMADLDPLARHELMGALMGHAAEYGTTVVMSSHVVAELEGSCDHLLLVGGGRIRLAGEIDDLLAPTRACRDRPGPPWPRTPSSSRAPSAASSAHCSAPQARCPATGAPARRPWRSSSPRRAGRKPSYLDVRGLSAGAARGRTGRRDGANVACRGTRRAGPYVPGRGGGTYGPGPQTPAGRPPLSRTSCLRNH